MKKLFKDIKKHRNLAEGLILVTLITMLAVSLQNSYLAKLLHLSTIIIAILLGMLVKNFLGIKRKMRPGIKFCAKKVLRFAIILLGFKLSLKEVYQLGLEGIFLIGLIVVATMFFTIWMGKVMKLSKNLSLLVASGCSICGAAAIIAVSALNDKEQEEDVSFSIGIITIFGTLFMLLYPLAQNLIHLSTSAYAFWAGTSVHEVAQVVAAGFAVSDEAGIMSTLVKLTRVLYIIPITFVISILRTQKNSKKFDIKNIQIPWFVIFFTVVILINSIFNIPETVINTLNLVCTYLMTAAMAGLGLETSFANMQKVGIKPLYLGIIASVFISFLSFGIIKILGI